MSRISKTGLYSLEVRPLGVLPGGGVTIGQSPTGPIMRPQIAPGASAGMTLEAIVRGLAGAAPVAADDINNLSVGAMNDQRNYFGPAAADPRASQNRLRIAASWFSALVRTVSSSGPTTTQDNLVSLLNNLNGWEQYMLSRRFTYNGITAQWPNPCPTALNCQTSIALLLADLHAHIAGVAQQGTSTTVSVPPSVPSGPGAILPRDNPSLAFTATSTMTNSPAANVIAQGGSGATASQTQTQTVLDANSGSGITTVVSTTGPTESIPGYQPVGVLDTNSPSSPVSGLPSWWKPALAIAIGAAVGVGVGRVIAR